MAFPDSESGFPMDSNANWDTCSTGAASALQSLATPPGTAGGYIDKVSRPASRSRSQLGSRGGISNSRPPTGAGGGPKTLPLRADVLLSNTLFEELDEAITPDFLRQYCGSQNLEEVDALEMQVDAVSGAQCVEGIGQFLPNLKQLKLNQSSICTVRDLGTSYAQLRVLWLNRSALQDIGGITAMPVLEELYISFNDVRDLSPLYTHDTLQVLDVEGNLIDDFDEIANLQTLATLRELSLSSNPLCKHETYSREAVLEALPQLEVLDDIMRGEKASEGLQLLDLSDCDADAAFLAGLDEDPISGSDKECQSILSRECLSPVALETMDLLEGDAVTEDTENSKAVAELRKAQAKLRAEIASPVPSPVKSPHAEPTEADLIVENLKRTRKQIPNIRSVNSMSARPATSFPDKTCNSFFPDRRGLKTAWSNSGSSTAYRPPSGTSGTFSSSAITSTSAAVHSAEDVDLGACNASDLTMGDDGSVLAGNALSAIRRRRKVAKERGEDHNSIRDMLRRFDTYAQESCLTEAELELRRRQSETKRPGTSDVRVSAPRLLTACGRPAAFPSSLPGAPGESWVKSGAKRPSSRPSSEFVDSSFLAPTFSTVNGEALIIE